MVLSDLYVCKVECALGSEHFYSFLEH